MMRLKLIFLLAFLLLALGWQGTRAQNVNHAGLVVRFGDGSVVTACVQFTSESVSGADLLRLSGMNVIVDPGSSFGEAICKISAGPSSDGCDFPLQDCFCQCRGVNCVYWAYYHLKDDAWEYSGQGASNWRVKDGDVEGWAWGPGSAGQSGVEPPVIPFDQICILSTPTPTPTDTPAATDTPTITPTSPLSTATPTPSPTVTSTPSPTPTATLSPTPTASPTLAPGVTPSPTATPRPPITIDFQLAPSTIEPGACAQLQWRITDADTAFLDDGNGESNVPLISEREVCPTQSTTYTLRAFRPDAQQSATQTLHVMMPAASPTPTATPTPTASPTPAAATATPAPPPTPAPTPESTAVIGPTPVVATFQPIQRLTPAPEPGSQSGGALLNLGIFAIVLALIAAAGAWALIHQ